MPLSPTVEDALLYLAGRSAVPLVGDGFAPSDSQFGHAMAERVALNIDLSAKQKRAAYRLLVRYVDQLREGGIEYGSIDLGQDARSPAVVAEETRVRRQGEPAMASVEGDRIVVRSPFSMKDACKSINSGRWAPRVKPRGAWTYPATPRAAANVRDALSPLGLEFDDAFLALLQQADIQRAAAVHKDAEDLPPVPGETMESWLHQRQAFWFARELDAALLAMDMGTGKSKVTVDLLRDWQARRVLIVCPLKVLGVWPKQFRLHAGDQFHVVNGLVQIKERWEAASVEGRTRMFDEALHECGCGRPHVIVVNYETTAFEPFKSWGLEQAWDVVVADEAHRWRAPQGVWSRWGANVRDRAMRRLGLTGTPMGQSMLDVFGIYRFLDNSIFGNSYTSFEHRYAVKGGFQNHEVVALRISPTLPGGGENPYYSPELAREFDQRFFSIAYEVSSDVLDLPENHPDIVRECELPPAARKAYNELKSDLFTDLESWNAGEVAAPNVLVKLLRLQQITGGHLTDDDGKTVVLHTAKADLLQEILEDIDPSESVVVFCRFVHDLDEVKRISEKMKRPYAELSGRRSDGLTHESTLALDRGVTAVQIQAGGVGVDFTKSAFCIFYSKGYSLIDYKQARKRLDRPGQTRPVRFIHLQAANTIDQEVDEALMQNEQNIEMVMKRRLLEHVAGGRMQYEAVQDALAIFAGF